MSRQRTEDYNDSEIILYTTKAQEYHYVSLESHRMYNSPRVNPNINHGLWVAMVYNVKLSIAQICLSDAGRW